jgi:hypothetical protein
MEVGLASTHAVAVMDNSVFWLGNDGIVYRAQGYTPQRISTHAIEQAIARCNLAQAFAFTFEDRGHKVFYLTFPDGQTWGYDAASGDWHRRSSYGLDRWRINTLTYWNGSWIAGDYTTNKLYKLDWNVQQEDGQPMERRRLTGVQHDGHNALILNGVALEVDTGLPGDMADADASIDVRYSKDGGRNWSAWRKLPMGTTGDFLKRLELRRLGMGRQWMFDIRVTDPVRADLIAAAALPEATQS